jgi:hypothetical protein
MQEPVADSGFMNIAGLWIVYLEGMVRPMTIGLINKLIMQLKNIAQKIDGKLCNILAAAFPA